jgi:hypothetical protein
MSMLFCFFALISSSTLLAQAESAFAEGVAQRDRGHRGSDEFRRAAQAWEQLREQGASSTMLLVQIGDAWQLSGDLPRAILNYRRAEQLAPEDRVVRRRLAQARDLVVYQPGTESRRIDDSLPRWMTSGRLRWLALLLCAGASLSLVRWWMVRKGYWLWTGLLCVVLFVFASWELASGRTPGQLVVVAQDGVLLRQGDGESYPAWSEWGLNVGVEAELLHRRGDWVQIALVNGEVGWIPVASVHLDSELLQ